MSNDARIGVTGIGIVSPLGNDPDSAWRRLMAGDSAIGLHGIAGSPDMAAARCDDDGSTLSRLQQVGTERISRIALSAALAAVTDAGAAPWSDGERVGLFLGSGMGGAATVDAAYEAFHSARRVAPLTIPVGMFNGAAAVIALHLQVRGPVITYAVACASSAVAIAEAAHALRRGDIDIAIAGGAEANLVPGTVAAWHALRTLAQPDPADVGDSCRPFSTDRNGLVLGEGSAFLVMQREHDLAQAGRVPHAWLAGSAVRCDAAHLTNPQVSGQVATLRAALRASGLSVDDIGYCNAHGTATVAGDPVECEALRQVWGASADALSVSSTKSAHGHLLGAAGALEAVWTVLALERRELPPTRGRSAIDPACQGVRHVTGTGESSPAVRHAVSNSFAFGGTNAALVFSRA